jgi:hypothetical protein
MKKPTYESFKKLADIIVADLGSINTDIRQMIHAHTLHELYLSQYIEGSMSGYLTDYIHLNYYKLQAIIIRRILDQDEKAISIPNIVKRIQRNKNQFIKEHFFNYLELPFEFDENQDFDLEKNPNQIGMLEHSKRGLLRSANSYNKLLDFLYEKDQTGDQSTFSCRVFDAALNAIDRKNLNFKELSAYVDKFVVHNERNSNEVTIPKQRFFEVMCELFMIHQSLQLLFCYAGGNSNRILPIYSPDLIKDLNKTLKVEEKVLKQEFEKVEQRIKNEIYNNSSMKNLPHLFSLVLLNTTSLKSS